MPPPPYLPMGHEGLIDSVLPEEVEEAPSSTMPTWKEREERVTNRVHEAVTGCRVHDHPPACPLPHLPCSYPPHLPLLAPPLLTVRLCLSRMDLLQCSERVRCWC